MNEKSTIVISDKHAWWCEFLHFFKVMFSWDLHKKEYGFYGFYCERCNRYYMPTFYKELKQIIRTH